jgi:hypothetical protein
MVHEKSGCLEDCDTRTADSQNMNKFGSSKDPEFKQLRVVIDRIVDTWNDKLADS